MSKPRFECDMCGRDVEGLLKRGKVETKPVDTETTP